MSTPIKPPGAPPGPDGPAAAGDAEPVGGADGSFRALVDAAGGAEAAPEADPSAGPTSSDEVVEGLVQRALASAEGLPEEHRAALEAQLREALEGDPTLAALQKDLERAISKA